MTTQPTHSDSLEELRDTVLIQASIVQSPKYNDSDSLVKSVDNIMKAIDHYTQSKLKAFAGEVEKAIGEDEYPEQHFPTVLQGENIEKYDKVTARDRLRAELRQALKAIKERRGIK